MNIFCGRRHTVDARRLWGITEICRQCITRIFESQCHRSLILLHSTTIIAPFFFYSNSVSDCCAALLTQLTHFICKHSMIIDSIYIDNKAWMVPFCSSHIVNSNLYLFIYLVSIHCLTSTMSPDRSIYCDPMYSCMFETIRQLFSISVPHSLHIFILFKFQLQFNMFYKRCRFFFYLSL